MIADYLDSSGTLSLCHTYTWGLDITGNLNATGGVGALLEMTNFPSGGGTTDYFPTYDGNGNIASLVNAGSGTVAAVYEYSPFGEPLHAQVSDSTLAAYPFQFGFSTKFTDAESGLIYYGNRFFNPKLGRFLNRDPFEEGGGLNLYGFCGNDGIDHFDVLGNSFFGDLVHDIGKIITASLKAGDPITPFRSTRNFLSPWLQDPSYYLEPQLYQKYFPEAAGIAVDAVVSYFAGPVVGGAAGGFVSGLDGGLMGGQSVGSSIDDGLIGAGIGAVSAEAGQISSPIIRPFAVATVDGAISRAEGGTFGQGFVTGLATSIASPYIQSAEQQNWYAGFSTSALVGGAVSAASGGSFGNGAFIGAGQYLAYNVPSAAQLEASQLQAIGITASESAQAAVDLVGKAWAAPDTTVGLLAGLASLPFGGHISGVANNAIQFTNVPWGPGGAITIGNVQLYNGVLPTQNQNGYDGAGPPEPYGSHEEGHTYQYQTLGPLFTPVYFLSGGVSGSNPFEQAADNYSRGGSWWP